MSGSSSTTIALLVFVGNAFDVASLTLAITLGYETDTFTVCR